MGLGGGIMHRCVLSLEQHTAAAENSAHSEMLSGEFALEELNSQLKAGIVNIINLWLLMMMSAWGRRSHTRVVCVFQSRMSIACFKKCSLFQVNVDFLFFSLQKWPLTVCHMKGNLFDD